MLDGESGHLLLVGEHHSSTASRRLVERVLTATTPTLVALESCPSRQKLFEDSAQTISEGAEVALGYARAEGCRIGLIDRAQTDLLTDISALPPEPVPFDAPTPDESGDIPLPDIQTHRDRIAEECPRRYDTLIQRREQQMAGFLATLCQTTDGAVVAIVGASHLPPLADYLETGTVQPRDIAEDRIRTVE